MIPVAVVLVVIAAILLAVGATWLIHAIIGLREALKSFKDLEAKVDVLAEAFNDLLIGNVDKVEIRALIRRTFYEKMEKRPR